jgi:hypothetical protein
VGGGIIIIAGNSINVTGSVVANGGTGYQADGSNADGSGAGGSILLYSNNSATLGTNLVTATGGPKVSYGGAGGAGRIEIYGTYTGTTNPTANNN